MTEGQEMMRRMARDLAMNVIAPAAADIDKTGRFPRDVISRMGGAGLFGLLIPPAFGGAGGERIDFVLVVEETATACASVGMNLVDSTGAAFMILAFGNDEQRKRYLPALAKGETLGAVAVTEPGGGANWQITLGTRAVADGDYYVLNGSKSFISNSSEAEIYMVLARTDMTKGPMGMSVFAVEKGSPGFSFGKVEEKLGLRGDPSGELVFEDCRVPKRNLLGQEGDGFKIIPAFAALSCAGYTAIAAGIARAALEASVRYTKERAVVESMSLANFDGVQSTVADMAAATEAVTLLAYRAAFPQEGGDPMVFMAAAFGKEMAMNVTGKAVELHGGYGCSKAYAIERYFRDAKTLCLHPSPIFLRLSAGKMLLGVPMGPSVSGGLRG